MTDHRMTRRSFLGASMAFAGNALVAERAQATSSPRAQPSGFLWGASTAAHQVEGNNVNSDYWVMEHVRPTLFKDVSGDACDHYHRYEEDFAIARALGFNSHRLSIEWSRIEPEAGMFSEAALDHYERVLESCHAHGLAPVVTYHHFTSPRWFAMRGGFEAKDSPDLFARFADKATSRLGHLIKWAATFNQPNLLLTVLWRQDIHALYPTLRPMVTAAAKACGSERFVTFYSGDPEVTLENYLSAHSKAQDAIRAGPGSFPVGVTLLVNDEHGVGSDSLVEVRKREAYGAWLEAAGKSDYVGVQTYTRNRTGSQGDLGPEEGSERTQMGYEYYPKALGGTLRYVAENARVPILITENGIGTDDDARRIDFIDTALQEVSQCMAEGVDVRGYMHWSLLDNFEWIYGYRPKFGLVEVDRKTFARKLKPSALHLSRIARSGTF